MPELGSLALHGHIDPVIREFAKAESLRVRPMYHDQPIWIVKDPQPIDAKVGVLQIRSFIEGGDELLSFVGTAYVVDAESHQIEVPRRAEPEIVRAEAFYSGSEFLPDALRAMLRTQWSRVSNQKKTAPEMAEAVTVPLSRHVRVTG